MKTGFNLPTWQKPFTIVATELIGLTSFLPSYYFEQFGVSKVQAATP